MDRLSTNPAWSTWVPTGTNTYEAVTGGVGVRTTSSTGVTWRLNSAAHLRTVAVVATVQAVPGTGTCNPRTVVKAADTVYAMGSEDGTAGNTTTEAPRKYRGIFGISPTTNRFEVKLFAFSGQAIWSDVHVYPT